MSIRGKLIIGFALLCVIFSLSAIVTLIQVNFLGNSIDLILKENYLSVVASQKIVNGSNLLLLSLKDDQSISNEKWEKFRNAYDLIEEGIKIEAGNITLDGEQELANQLIASLEKLNILIPPEKVNFFTYHDRKYYQKVDLEIRNIIAVATKVSDINQLNMLEAKETAKRKSNSIRNLIWVTLIVSFATTIYYLYLSNHWILKPLKILTEYSKEIQDGNFDLSYTKLSDDEIGQLGNAFNQMIFSLRFNRNENEKKISHTQHVVSEVFKSIPIPLAILDSDGKVELATEKAKKIFDLIPGQSIWSNRIKIIGESAKEVFDKSSIVKNKEGEYLQIFQDRNEYFYEFQVIPLFSQINKSQLNGVLVSLDDITSLIEQKELKKNVLSTVSHQLKSPLTTIQMALYVLLDGKIGELNQKQIEVLMAGKHESDRLIQIISDILDLSKMEAKKSILKKSEYSPYEIIENCILNSIDLANSNDIKILNESDIKSVKIKIDLEKMKHVFANLISNAIRFSPVSGIIRINAEETGNYIVFTISDEGKGISSEDLPYIFDSFYRGAAQEENTGVGIGLSIAKEIVQLHGGNISCKSEIGVGTTFAISLPVS
ncbi:ATP-binding protein [Leptospira sp. 96542]|nr:ATP-binding protein [Leptospira sp. 96542]